MSTIQENCLYHAKEAAYFTVSLLGRLSSLGADLFLISAFLNVISNPENILRGDLVRGVVAAGLIHLLSRPITLWAERGNQQAWVDHLNSSQG